MAGRAVLRDWLWNRARSFVFSTGLAPVSAAAAVRALQQVRRAARAPRARGRARPARLRDGLVAAGAVTALARAATAPRRAGEPPRLLGFGHIVPVVLSARRRARSARRSASRGLGVHVPAIRPPTVPAGAARIRLTVTAQHTDEDIDRAIDAFASALRADACEPADVSAPPPRRHRDGNGRSGRRTSTAALLGAWRRVLVELGVEKPLVAGLKPVESGAAPEARATRRDP